MSAMSATNNFRPSSHLEDIESSILNLRDLLASTVGKSFHSTSILESMNTHTPLRLHLSVESMAVPRLSDKEGNYPFIGELMRGIRSRGIPTFRKEK
jgi:hypothetical protein